MATRSSPLRENGRWTWHAKHDASYLDLSFLALLFIKCLFKNPLWGVLDRYNFSTWHFRRLVFHQTDPETGTDRGVRKGESRWAAPRRRAPELRRRAVRPQPSPARLDSWAPILAAAEVLAQPARPDDVSREAAGQAPRDGWRCGDGASGQKEMQPGDKRGPAEEPKFLENACDYISFIPWTNLDWTLTELLCDFFF